MKELAGLVLAQRVIAAIRKAGAVDRVSVTPRGTVIEARLQNGGCVMRKKVEG